MLDVLTFIEETTLALKLPVDIVEAAIEEIFRELNTTVFALSVEVAIV
jgi:hypothetical protein